LREVETLEEESEERMEKLKNLLTEEEI